MPCVGQSKEIFPHPLVPSNVPYVKGQTRKALDRIIYKTSSVASTIVNLYDWPVGSHSSLRMLLTSDLGSPPYIYVFLKPFTVNPDSNPGLYD